MTVLLQISDAHFGTEVISRAALDIAPTYASGTVKAIEDAVLSASPEPLEDDATLIVLAPVDSPEP